MNASVRERVPRKRLKNWHRARYRQTVDVEYMSLKAFARWIQAMASTDGRHNIALDWMRGKRMVAGN
jgi:hypothetical protein